MEHDSDSGLIKFAGQRALIIDAMAMGILRKELIETSASPQPARSSRASASSTAGEWPKR
jgi:hypothetical protein